MVVIDFIAEKILAESPEFLLGVQRVKYRQGAMCKGIVTIGTRFTGLILIVRSPSHRDK